MFKNRSPFHNGQQPQQYIPPRSPITHEQMHINNNSNLMFTQTLATQNSNANKNRNMGMGNVGVGNVGVGNATNGGLGAIGFRKIGSQVQEVDLGCDEVLVTNTRPDPSCIDFTCK